MNKKRVIQALENIFHADYDEDGFLMNDTFDIGIMVTISEDEAYVDLRYGTITPYSTDADAKKVCKEVILHAALESDAEGVLAYPYNCNLSYVPTLISAIQEDDDGLFSARHVRYRPRNWR